MDDRVSSATQAARVPDLFPAVQSASPSYRVPPSTATRACELHLLAETTVDGRPALRALVPDAGVSYLAAERVPLRLTRRKPRYAALAVEPVSAAGGSRSLLVLSPQALAVRCNALPAPPVLLLGQGDELRTPAGVVFHIAEFSTATAGTPPRDLVGRPCGVCRLPLAAKTSILSCRRCGVPMHQEGPLVPTVERLECATFAGRCPSCDLAVVAGGNYAWLPDGLDLLDGVCLRA